MNTELYRLIKQIKDLDDKVDSLDLTGSYTDEKAQDAIGTILTDTATVDMTYDDSTPSIKADLRKQNSNSINLSSDANGLKADLNTQNTTSINLSVDASGLKAVANIGTSSGQVADGALCAAKTIAPATNTADKFPQWNGADSKTLKDGYSLSDLMLAMHPVGCIYTSVSSTSPATLFGGTWAAFGAGKVLVGIDSGDTSFDTVEETGGAKTHTLTSDEMPSHYHTDLIYNETGRYIKYGSGTGADKIGLTLNGASTSAHSIKTGNAGSGNAHNNLQPYIVVYMWKRTA